MAGGIVPGSTKLQTSKKGGRPDLQTLLEHSEIHPKGRVEIDPLTGLVKNPKNNILFKKRINIRVEGQVVGQREVAVNGGHAKEEGSVWRIVLKGPARYHQMIVADDYRATHMGRGDRTAPELTDEEMEEYQYFRAYLSQNKIKFALKREDVEALNKMDDQFYKWLDKQEKDKIELVPMSVETTAPTDFPVK